MRSLGMFILGITFAIVITAITAHSAASQNRSVPNDALGQDAGAYAQDRDVSLATAVDRLELQDAAGDLDAALAEGEPETFAGLYIEHEPEFRVVVRLTEGGEEEISPYVKGRPLEDVVEVESASATLEELEEAQELAEDAADNGRVEADTLIDVRANSVKVRATDEGPVEGALADAPDRQTDEIRVFEVDELAAPEAGLFGGTKASSYPRGSTRCTWGFAVKRVRGAEGLITAAHCPNGLYYGREPMRYRAGRYSGSYDVQFNTSTGNEFDPSIRDGIRDRVTPNYRRIATVRGRSRQAVGSLVCKYGQTTGNTCGYIKSRHFRPGYVPNAQPTFIQVIKGRGNLSSAGDSGGPWFSGNTALGVHSGGYDGSGNSYSVYMPINYAHNLGLRVLTVR